MSRMQIIGHRGNKTKHDENTLQGFESVFTDSRIDGVELDVVVSQDKKLFVSHNLYAKHDKEVRWHHLFDYQQIINTVSECEGAASRFPLLEQVFSLYKACGSNQSIQIEVKSDPSLAPPLEVSELITIIQSMMQRYNLQANASITSFDYRYIVESKRQDTSVKTGLILHRNLLPLASILSMEADAIVFEKSWIIQKEVQKLNSLGVNSYAWTANSEHDWIRLKQLGVSGIITDRPSDLANWLKE